MNAVIVPAASVLLIGWAHVTAAEPPGKALAALEQKMLGAWKGRTTCDGCLIFRADGTYQLTGYGPASCDSAGTWQVRGDALPATLVLTCKTSDIPAEVGKATEVRLAKLDDESLAIEYANQNGSPSGRYSRVKRQPRTPHTQPSP
jgi:hypothetical protein